jgi:hypothetical protein
MIANRMKATIARGSTPHFADLTTSDKQATTLIATGR